MKKNITLLIIALLFGAFLTACGGEVDPAQVEEAVEQVQEAVDEVQEEVDSAMEEATEEEAMEEETMEEEAMEEELASPTLKVVKSPLLLKTPIFPSTTSTQTLVNQPVGTTMYGMKSVPSSTVRPFM